MALFDFLKRKKEVEKAKETMPARLADAAAKRARLARLAARLAYAVSKRVKLWSFIIFRILI